MLCLFVLQATNEGQTAKEVFNMYAKDGVLRAEDLGTALRSVGRRLTGEQVLTYIRTYPPSRHTYIIHTLSIGIDICSQYSSISHCSYLIFDFDPADCFYTIEYIPFGEGKFIDLFYGNFYYAMPSRFVIFIAHAIIFLHVFSFFPFIRLFGQYFYIFRNIFVYFDIDLYFRGHFFNRLYLIDQSHYLECNFFYFILRLFKLDSI